MAVRSLSCRSPPEARKPCHDSSPATGGMQRAFQKRSAKPSLRRMRCARRAGTPSELEGNFLEERSGCRCDFTSYRPQSSLRNSDGTAAVASSGDSPFATDKLTSIGNFESSCDMAMVDEVTLILAQQSNRSLGSSPIRQPGESLHHAVSLRGSSWTAFGPLESNRATRHSCRKRGRRTVNVAPFPSP